jgi:pimeloyl-ACP methyl ester carboxylesterase
MSRHALTLVSCSFLPCLAAGCSAFEPDESPAIIHARFDPDEKVIPMPSDVLRDDVAGRLDLPIDDTLTPAENELYTYLNTLDGWSSASAAKVEFTAPIAPGTVTDESLEIWKWGTSPARVDDAFVHIADDERSITIDAPRTGWERGTQYAVVLRGKDAGVEGKAGEQVECDAAFYFLRQTEALDTAEHARAFPGNTAAERADNARKLEDLRLELAPQFDYLAQQGIPRDEVAALWRFTITTRVELAMDKASQRMPLPIQLLIDPETGKVDLPPAAWDTAVEAEAKERLRAYDGFATSANLLFELTGRVKPATVTGESVQLWRLGSPPVREPAAARLMDDGVHVVIMPNTQPLATGTGYAVVVTDDVEDLDGHAIISMPAGALLKARAPVAEGGLSKVGVVADEDALRLEDARGRLGTLLDQVGRDHVVAAWPFVTMQVKPRLDVVQASAATIGVSPDPVDLVTKTPGQALGDFPLAISSLFNVDRVVTGAIESPYYLDDVTRGVRADGGHRVDKVAFTMTVPRNVPAGQAIPVVIFGHAIMTERRFVMAIGDALAAKGFAAVSIDFPYHGTRTRCIAGGPISVVNPTTGELTSLPPCASGTTCNELGKCVDANGQGNQLSQWPLLNYPIASGAAFLEIEHIANTKDHFDQAMVDLGAIERSLRTGDWSGALGRPVDKTKIYYAGQSLGGILGATYLSGAPDVRRAVLNVPGADLVDMFSASTWFGPQVSAFFTRERIDRDSYEAERFLDVARWIVDAVDPQNLGESIGSRDLLIQMATLDFIIPNDYTKTLERVTGAPRRDYTAEHAFLVIPVEPEFARGGRDLAAFLAGELTP